MVAPPLPSTSLKPINSTVLFASDWAVVLVCKSIRSPARKFMLPLTERTVTPVFTRTSLPGPALSVAAAKNDPLLVVFAAKVTALAKRIVVPPLFDELARSSTAVIVTGLLLVIWMAPTAAL